MNPNVFSKNPSLLTVRNIRELLDAPSFIPPGWDTNQNIWEEKRSQALRVLTLFTRRYGEQEREILLGFVPGRVEVFGKHTDYAGGHSLVVPLDRGFVFAAALNDGSVIQMCEDSKEFLPIEFPLSPDIDPILGEWGNYPMTAVQRLSRNFMNNHPLKGVDIAFCSDLPVGSGMSGSSALLIMTFFAVAETNSLASCPRFRTNITSGIDLAMYLACVENGQNFRALLGGKGVGTFGGSEDHTAIINGRTGALSLFQFSPTVPKGEIIWPRDWQLVICFSGIRAEKTGKAMEKYNRLPQRARRAVEIFNRYMDCEVSTLREIVDLSGDALPSSFFDILRNQEAPTEREWDITGRITQFFLEDRRFIPAALQSVVWQKTQRFGSLCNCSHSASKRLLNNIVPEIEFLQKAAIRSGSHGASGFGGGFGGSLFAVIPRSHTQDFLASWEHSYQAAFPAAAKEASFIAAYPSDGAQVWSRLPPRRWVDTIFSEASC